MPSASPNLRHSRPNSDASAFSSSKIAARISLRHAYGRRGGGGSGWRGPVPRAPPEDDVVARQRAPGDSRSPRATGGSGKRSEIGDYYREMLGLSPSCSLLLRNSARGKCREHLLMTARCGGRTRTFCGRQGKRMKKRSDRRVQASQAVAPR